MGSISSPQKCESRLLWIHHDASSPPPDSHHPAEENTNPDYFTSLHHSLQVSSRPDQSSKRWCPQAGSEVTLGLPHEPGRAACKPFLHYLTLPGLPFRSIADHPVRYHTVQVRQSLVGCLTHTALVARAYAPVIALHVRKTNLRAGHCFT